MVIGITKVKGHLWFCAFLISALSFPIQVYAGTPYPALLPYSIIFLIFFIRPFHPKKSNPKIKIYRRDKTIGHIIAIYIFLVIFDAARNAIKDVSETNDVASVLIVFLFPSIYYYYFRQIASEQEIRSSLKAMIVAGLILGIYFINDSILKLVFGGVSDYAQMAFQYTVGRSGMPEEQINTARIAEGARSHGLLESHSVSSAYVAMSSFAALTLLPAKNSNARWPIILAYFLMLLIALNFTSIVAFSAIIVLAEFHRSALFRWRAFGNYMLLLASISAFVIMVLSVTFLVVDNSIQGVIANIFSVQMDYLFGLNDSPVTFGGKIADSFREYCDYIRSFPASILFGDGFSRRYRGWGGDFGLTESIAAFGLVFSIAILICILKIIKSSLNAVINHRKEISFTSRFLPPVNVLNFAVYVILFAAISELHYSVWFSKAISPIIFFALALADRYLNFPEVFATMRGNKNPYNHRVIDVS